MKTNSLPYIITCLISILLAECVLAQGQKNIWMVPHYSGLDFSTGEAVVMNLNFGESINSNEGSATANSKDGELLFYSNGREVKDAEHNIMPNGKNITGSSTSAQGVLIVPDPSDSNSYYLFTAFSDNFSEKDTSVVCLSKVNLSLNNNLGDVTIKNDTLLQRCTEMLTGVYHKNNKDIWVLAHEKNSANYYTWLITENGIQEPIIQSIGRSFTSQSDFIGCMNFSPDGKQLAVASNKLELLDFNNETGKLSNHREIYTNGKKMTAPYDLEFSASGKYLYSAFKNGDYIMQLDLSRPSVDEIINSMTTIDTADASSYGFGTLMRGPDNKIYIAQSRFDYVGVINHPDSSGLACNINQKAIPLKNSTYGLPNFLPYYPSQDEGPLTIRSQEPLLKLKSWPNPSTSKLTVKWTLDKAQNVILYDGFGQEKIRKEVMGKKSVTLDVRDLIAGTYLLQVISISGEISSQKILKKD